MCATSGMPARCSTVKCCTVGKVLFNYLNLSHIASTSYTEYGEHKF